MQSKMQSNTPFFELPSYEIPQVDDSTIFHISGCYSRDQGEMDSTFFNVLKFACQKVDDPRAHHPQQPIMMSKDSVKPPVVKSLIVRDVDLEKFVRRRDDVDLEKFVRCDISEIHTLVFSLTNRQYKYECATDFARVVYFFTLNKFPSLKCLVLNNVYLTDKLILCLQQYKLKFLHLWYFSWENSFDNDSTVSFETDLKKFQTLSVEEFRIDTSEVFTFHGFKVKLSRRQMKRFILNILGSNSYNIKGKIIIDAEDSYSLEILQVYCDPSFAEIIEIIPPTTDGVLQKFACHATRKQIKFRGGEMDGWRWGNFVVELCIDPAMIDYTGTTFPRCRVLTSYHASDKAPTTYRTINTSRITPITKCTCCFTCRFKLVYVK